ncbi:MAG: GspE/PulE family protein [Candidatus Falkowbacteria bacterium]
MSDLTSIDNLIHDDLPEEGSVLDKFSKKQDEIKAKEIERSTERQAGALGFLYINLVGYPISPDALALIDEETSKKLGVICFYYDGQNVQFGTTRMNQPVIDLIKDLSERYFSKSSTFLISKNSFEHAFELYKTLPKVKPYEGLVEISEEKLNQFEKELTDYHLLNEKINNVNISDVVTLMLAAAIKIDASDIHVEAEERGAVIRLRIDGVLQEAAVITGGKWQKIATRVKILAKVKINITDKPQDGRFSIGLSDRRLDVRASFLPTNYGESVVLRLLDSSATALEFEELGIRTEVFEILKQEITKPNGLILTTGPTGSGKTTSLYAIVNKLNRPGTKIITLEDPIEYQLVGINQSQVDTSKGYSFSDGLRSILRQDPNVLMIGEIRDLETAEIAVQASITGHLVLSTLHTNDAAGVIPRLIDLGVKPYFLVPSINAVIGQRLVRRLCVHCKTEHVLKVEEKELVNKILSVISPKSGVSVPNDLPVIYKAGPGCALCNYTGYKKRLGIYEIFTMADNIKQLTIDKAPSFKILQQAIENGMITMLQDGVLKCFDGITSLEEVYRVIGNFDYVNELYDIVISQTIGRGLNIGDEVLTKAKTLSQDVGQMAEFMKKIPSKEVITLIMALAIQSSAGDIHIEPNDSGVKVRFRIDGVLHDVVTLPISAYLPVLSEIKILAGFATNVKMATLDGRFSLRLSDRKMDCRLSIISGGYGETIVIRLLADSAASLNMETLGITSVALNSLQGAIKKTKGIIITTGPTGSGKTTTLYSILNRINKPDVKIITVEDPIEYQLPGIMQTQIDTNHGYTFASAMRSLLRQNPNIMMIGEIRDNETAKIAIEAASTGHLVLSTLHANSAAGAISRFSGLGVERQALANSLEFAIGQRLVRKLCPYCKKPATVDEETINRVRGILSQINNPNILIPKELNFFTSTGCDKCSNIGYKGRIGLYETINISPDIQKLIQNPDMTDYEIEQAAVKNGTVPMVCDGILKALIGETSLDEVFRVI